jgi:hypothetical protein
MNIEGNNTLKPFDQNLNTYDNVDFTRVDVSGAIIDNSQLATKLYVDTHGGGGGGGDMNYTGTTPATNYIYKSASSDGKSATKSNIVDTGATVTVITTLQCLALDGQAMGGNLNIGNNQATVTIPATNGIIANKFVKSGGLVTDFLKGNGTVDTSTYLTTTSASSTYVPLSGGTMTGNLTSTAFVKSGGLVTDFLKGNGTVDTSTYLTTTTAGTTYVPLSGGTMTGNLTSTAFVKSGGLVTDFLKGNGTVDTSTYVTNPTYNLGVSTLNNALIILPMTADFLPSGYLATSNFAGTANFQAFDLNTATYYSSYANYSSLTGTYTGYIQTPLLPFGTLNGDWLQIEYPSPISVMGYTISSSVSLSQVPSTFTLLTSTDNVNWTAQDSEVAVQWVLGTSKSYTFPSPITSKYFRLSVYLVGNTGTSSRTNFVINELTLTQNTATSVTVPTLISNKTTFTNNNELISKQYVDTSIYSTNNMVSSLYFTSSATLSATNGYMPSSGLVTIGSVTTLVAQASTNSFTKIFRVNNPPSSTADGAKSGYLGTTSFPKIYVGTGFIYNVSFGIGDTNTAATSVCQMFVGLQIATTTPLLMSSLGPATAASIIGVGCDLGNSVLSFYSNGVALTTKIPTTYSCATPSQLWFNLTITNQNNSNVVLLTLSELTTNTSVSQSYTLSGLSTGILNTSLLYPCHTRAMATAGGVVGAANTLFGKFQLYLK